MPRRRTVRTLRFLAFDASGKPSTKQVLDFRGAWTLGFSPVGDYARTPTSLEVRWPGNDPIQVFLRWEEPAYGPAYLVLDNAGKGYSAGGTRNLNVELARSAWRWFDGAYQENLRNKGMGFEPSAKLNALRNSARRALTRISKGSSERTRAMAASRVLADTLHAWTLLLKEHGHAFARRHRRQFILGAMMTEPFPDAWQYSVPGMFSDYEKRLELMNAEGLDTVGIPFLWREDYTFSRPETFAPYDRVIDHARRLGLNVMVMVLDSFDYLTHRNLSDEEFIEASRVQARNLAGHYKGRVKFWTVTDETNGKNFLPHTFAARLKAGNDAARAIKRVDPSAVTLATLLFDEDFLPLLARLKRQRAIVPQVDVIALSLFHHLGPGADIVYRKIHELFPAKKIGVGETGYTAGKDCELIYTVPLNYPYSLGGGFWWFHWDGMIDRGIDGQWYATRFYRIVQDLAGSIGDGVTQAGEAKPDASEIARGVTSDETPPPRNDYEAAAWRGVQWLLGSGVCNPKTGAVARGYDPSRMRFLPPDVSSAAVALQVFVRAYGCRKDSVFLDAARRAADFLLTRQWQGSGRRACGGLIEPSGSRHDESLANARAIDAWLDFYFATGDERYLEVSEKAADWLLEIMQNADGSFKSAYDLKSKSFLDGARDDWRQSRAFAHAKIAAALLKTWEAVRETEPRYRDGALRVLAWALTLQNFNGSFKSHYNPRCGQASDDKFMASLLDGVGGFFCAYVQLLRHPRDIALHPVYLEACRSFAAWLKRLAWSLKGAIPDWILGDDSLGEPAVLPTAQAIRLWLRLHLVSGEPGSLAAAKVAGNFLLKAQDRSDDPRRTGGFPGENPSTQDLALSVSATAASVLALYELSDVVENPQTVLDPVQPRYAGFDPLL
jgi:hypothetical protein